MLFIPKRHAGESSP